jgi:hypothetical protein
MYPPLFSLGTRREIIIMASGVTEAPVTPARTRQRHNQPKEELNAAARLTQEKTNRQVISIFFVP